MGRFAYFNTDFDYKFWFGVQPSEDIECFGGYRVVKMLWSKEEHFETVKDELTQFASKHKYDLPDFDRYEKTATGTRELYDDLLDKYDGDRAINAKFCLGCLIYHQLTYTDRLVCSYEE